MSLTCDASISKGPQEGADRVEPGGKVTSTGGSSEKWGRAPPRVRPARAYTHQGSEVGQIPPPHRRCFKGNGPSGRQWGQLLDWTGIATFPSFRSAECLQARERAVRLEGPLAYVAGSWCRSRAASRHAWQTRRSLVRDQSLTVSR